VSLKVLLASSAHDCHYIKSGVALGVHYIEIWCVNILTRVLNILLSPDSAGPNRAEIFVAGQGRALGPKKAQH